MNFGEAYRFQGKDNDPLTTAIVLEKDNQE